MKKLLLAAVLLIMLSCPVLAAPAFSSLEEQMTGKDFTATGLHKLTPEELAALNNWIRARSLATLETATPPTGTGTADDAPPADSRGFNVKKSGKSDRTAITSRVMGTFTGWDGNTLFKLENGMIWEQDDKDKFYVKPVENPVVTIKPHMFNTWRLSIEGHASECKVRRVQ